MDYSLHAYIKSNSYSTDMDYPSTNQALFALVVMIIVLLFILVYCCSGAFPCSNSNNSEDSVTGVDPTGRRIRYPLLPRTRRRSPSNDQDVSRERSSSRRSAVVIVPVNGIMYCCDDSADGSLSDSMRAKPPAYGDLFKAPPPYSVGTSTPSPTPETESVFPPAYEDSFKDWKLTFDNDNRFDLLHQSRAAEAPQAPSGRLNDLVNEATFASSGSESNTLTSNIISVLSKDYNSQGLHDEATTALGLSATATNSSTDSRHTSHKFSRNEHTSQRAPEVGTFSSHTSHSADDLNKRISSSNESPVTVNFNSMVPAEPNPVYIGPSRRQPHGSRVHGSHKFPRSASANLPDDSSYYSNNDLVVSGQQRWSAEGNSGTNVSTQQRQSTVGNGASGEAALQTRPKHARREALRFQMELQDGRKDIEESEQQYLTVTNELQQQQPLTGRKWFGASSDHRKQTSEMDLDCLASTSQRCNPDTEFTFRSERHLDHLEMTNGRPTSTNIPLNDLNSEDHHSRFIFSSCPMNITGGNGGAAGLTQDGLNSCEGRTSRNPHNASLAIPSASQTDHQHSPNHSCSSSDLHSTNKERSLDPRRDNFHGRIHAPSFFCSPRNVSPETAAEFQRDISQRNAPKVLPARVPDSDVDGLIRDLVAAENQRRELPAILNRAKSCDSVHRQLESTQNNEMTPL